jgi:hypothetical protein
MERAEQIQAVRDSIVVLTCGYCWRDFGEDQVLDWLRLHPALEAVIPDHSQRIRGRGVRRVAYGGYREVGALYPVVGDDRGFRERAIEQGGEAGTITWYCPRGHTHPFGNERLLEGFLSVARSGSRPRARLRAGVDI